jgi:exopolyphosphatase/guanosine-5'-triphosphate,3'-diphosphate pyrophosphatase
MVSLEIRTAWRVKLAAIDIGSNSIKLIVVDAVASDSFSVLTREKDVVRLGHDTLREGYLSPAAIERAVASLTRFRSIAEARGATRIYAIATASVREAHNRAKFITEVERHTGIRVEILSGIEEARLIGVAAAQGCGARGASLINIDIGGGSTEISFVRDGMPSELYSVKLGAVGLTERFIFSDPPKAKELRALKTEIRNALERPRRELRPLRWQHATGTSGTIISIGEALEIMKRARVIELRKRGAQGALIVFSQLAEFNERAAQMSVEQRRALPCISQQRAEIVVAGGQILEGAMRALELNALRTCDWALREGVIIERLREIEAEARPPVPDISDQKLRGVHALGRRFSYEEGHARRVAHLAEKIYDTLFSPADNSNRHQRALLSAAALLHDIGYTIAHESHHKHSHYLIKHSELTGFSESERNVIANVARYHRGAPPKARHPDYAALSETDRATVCCLAAILRIAEALDRSHEGRVQDVELKREGQIVRLQLRSALNCEKEVWAAARKVDMFEQAFNCKLRISSRRAKLQRA